MRLFVFVLFCLLFSRVTDGHASVAKKPLPTNPETRKEARKQREPAPEKTYKENEILVKFKANVPEERKTDLNRKHGSEKVKEFPELRLHHLKLKGGITVEEAVRLYQSEPDVEYAEPNFIYTIQGDPGDPRFGELWGFRNTGQTGGTVGADIKATAAWDITTGSSDVIVAVIDTGIDYTHPDLAANLWMNVGIDTINQDSDPFDDNGHGTHVAGTIGAVGGNGAGVVGVNWNVRLTACKFLGAGGSGATDGAVQCLQYIKSLKDAGANIVATSNSWGGGAYSQALYDAINAQRDILFIAAAGNSGADMDGGIHYPSSYNLPNIIAVAATDHNDSKAGFSNYGKRTVHVSAPGAAILSTLPATNDWSIAGGYGLLSGTSMATPHVTGLAALLKAQDPSRDWIAIKNLIISGGDDVGSMQGHTISGKRINAYGSLTCAGRKLLAATQYPDSLTVGTAVTLSAVSIDCGVPSGPVTVTLSGGEVIALHDDGVAPDLAAGDGVFAAVWTPARQLERLRFSSPAGTETVEYPSLAIASIVLPTGHDGAQYRQTLRAGGGYFPYSWSVRWGRLPDGITLNSATGEVSGTPIAPGVSYFTLQLQDAYGAKALKDFSLTILPATVFEGWKGNSVASQSVDIGMDMAGNAYVATYDFSLTKFNPDGSTAWSGNFRQPGGTQYAVGVGVSPDGTSYVGGLVCSSWSGNACYYDKSAVVKFDPAGTMLWSVFDSNYSTTYDTAIDGAGNVYLTGKEKVNGNIRTVKYDTSGKVVWTASTEPPFYMGWTWDPFMTVDSNMNVYVTGYMESTTYPSDIFVIKYDRNGTKQWLKIYDTGGEEIGKDIAVDGDGNIYVAGTSLKSPSSALLLKLDPNGNLLWNRAFAAGFGGEGLGLTISGNNIYITGSLQGTPYIGWDQLLLKYDADGNNVWAMTFPSSYGADRIALGPTGDLFIASGYEPMIRKIDISPPITTASTAGGTYESGFDVTLITGEPSTIHYTLDGSTPTTASPVYDGPIAISASATLQYFAVDTVGHAEEVKAQVYQLLPKAVVTGAPVGPTNTVEAVLAVGGANIVAYRYSLDGGGYSAEIPVTTPITLIALAEGTHSVAVLGKDGGGSWQVTATAVTWNIDLTPPVAVITGASSTGPNAIFGIGGSSIATYRYSIDGAPFSDEIPAHVKIPASSLSEGPHTLQAVGKDAAGNWQVIPTSFSWTVDGWPVSLPSSGVFRTLAEAYAALAGDDTLQVKAMSILEDLLFDRPIGVLLKGGYDPGSGTSTGSTCIYGRLQITGGTVTVENLVLAPPM